MAAPCYASTEWVGLGQANLRFRPKRKTTQPVDPVQIDCYLSAVYIREYGEKKKQKVNEEKTKEPQSDLKPPGIAPEVWTAWEEYWGAWKEVLIPLSWVHKYREHSTPDHIKWHDSYLEDYPDVLPLITDELGRSELSSHTTTCQSESTTDVVDYDYIYGEEKEQDDESSRELQEAVGGEAGTAAENECEPDKPGRKESNKGATEQSTDSENSQSVDELDLTEFYDYIYPDETPENSQKHHTGETDKNGMVGANLRQEHASEGTADMNTAADTTEEESKEKRKKVLDELYERHTKSRYWVHLRHFLHLSGIECHPEIELFYEQKAGIKFIQPSAKSCSGVTRDTEELSSVVDSKSYSVEGEYQPEDKHSERRQKRKRKAKRKPEENYAEAPTSEERLQSISCVPQEADGSNSGEENLKDDSSEEIKTTESETMDVEGGSSSGDGGSVQAANSVTMNSASASSSNKQKKAKKRKKDTARPQGLSWALKHVKESKQAETTSKALEPLEVAPETPEAAPGTHEATSESVSSSLEAASGPSTSDSKLCMSTDEEEYCIAYFLDEMDEAERKGQKKHAKRIQEEALHEFLQEKSTGLMNVCQVTVNKAAAALHELLLPLTAVHLLNVSFPGAAVMEYESSVTEEVPGEREKLKQRFDSFVFNEKERLKRCLAKLGKFCLTTWTDAVVPVSLSHLTNFVFKNASEIEHQFPPDVFGVRWLPKPESSFQVDGKNVKRSQRRFYNWLEVQDPNLSPSATVELRGMIMNRMSHSNQDPRKPQWLYQQVVREEKEDATEGGGPCLTLHTLHLLQESSKTGMCGGDEGNWSSVQVTFDQDGYSGISNTDQTSQSTEDAKAKAEEEMWQRIISGCRRLAFFDTDNSMPSHLPHEIQKYWAQRYRLFLKYDEGIKLDTESWYSVTPELLAAHQARRCRCKVVVDALCGAGGNAIQLAKTCSHVIAIDKDPKKIELARHNAEVYGVAHHIDFRVGDFFKLAPYLKADVVYLSPPWGGMEYQEELVYNVYRLGGSMNCARLLRAARAITPNVALYLPRNSNLCQVIALAGAGGVVDIEANYMGPKKKAITAYFGDLATKTWC